MSRYPHHREGKLLSISTLTYEEGKPTSSGEAQFLSVKEQVEIWYIMENITSLVFGTTSTNTGCRKESNCMQEWLDKPVFYFWSCHHIAELIVKAS